MSPEPIILRAPDGRESTGHALVERNTLLKRIALASMWVFGGLILGGACIFVPVAHLVGVWAVPLGGIWMAVRTLQSREEFAEISGPCPACGASMHLTEQGVRRGSMQSCPHCDSALQVRLQLPAGAPTGTPER